MKPNSYARIIAATSIGVTTVLAWLFAGDSLRSAPAQPPEKTSASGEETSDKERKEFAEYRSWQPVGEPVKLPESLIRPCGPTVDYRRDPGIHGDGYISVYVNAIGKDSYLKERAPVFAEGTVIVKEKLKNKEDKQPQEIAIMIKRKKGFDRLKGDWQFYFVDDKNEFIRHRQMPNYCASCHTLYDKTDYVARKSWPALEFRKAE